VVVSRRWAGLRALELEVYIVTGVRKETSADGTHRHISGVCTQGGIRHTRQEVVDSIRAGNRWKTLADGREADIQPVDTCPHPGCTASPYIRSNPDSTEKDNLENLDAC
jgi:Protein of unknown function (DUF3892)